MMKIGQISDLHYSPDHLDEVDRCVKFAIDRMVEDGCECAVISGDLFDHRVDLHDPCVYQLMKRVLFLARNMPVLILQGTFSHDTPGSLNIFKAMNGAHPIYVADHIGQVALINNGDFYRWEPCTDSYSFSDIPDYTVALFSCLPPINKGHLAALNDSDDIASAAGEYVYDLMRGWSVINGQALAAGIPTVVVSHGTVNNCMTEQGVPMHGNDHEFTTGSLFASNARAIMLGHIHQFQYWSSDDGYQMIAYPGSPGRLHFGELTDKCFLIWDVESTHSSFKIHQTPAKRLIQIEFDGTPDLEKLKAIAEGAEDAYVRIRYSVDEEHKDSIDKNALHELFADAGLVKIEGRIKPITRIRAEGITRSHSLEEKLATWCTVTDSDFERIQPCLAEIQSTDPEHIVAEIINNIEDAVS